MQCKRRVLKRFPEARLEVVSRYPTGEPLYHAVFNGDQRLDIYDPDIGRLTPQGTAAAWRSAHFWCIRNPAPKDNEP